MSNNIPGIEGISEVSDAQSNDDPQYNEAGERAFVTGLVDEANEKEEHDQAVGVLKKCVDSIDSHFKKVLATHEKDFMAAYQVNNFLA